MADECPPSVQYYRGRRIYRITRHNCKDFLAPPEPTPENEDKPMVLVNGEWVNGENYFSGGVYVHDQVTPSTIWTIEHNLNDATPRIVFFDSTYTKIAGVQDMAASTYDVAVYCFSFPVAGSATVYGG